MHVLRAFLLFPILLFLNMQAGCDLTFESGTRDIRLLGPPHPRSNLWQLPGYRLAETEQGSLIAGRAWIRRGADRSLSLLAVPTASEMVTEFALPNGEILRTDAPDKLASWGERSLTMVWQSPGQPGRVRFLPAGAGPLDAALPPDVQIKHSGRGSLLYWDPRAPRVHILRYRASDGLTHPEVDWPADLDPKSRPELLDLRLDDSAEYLLHATQQGALVMQELRSNSEQDLGKLSYLRTEQGLLFFVDRNNPSSLVMHAPALRRSFLLGSFSTGFRVTRIQDVVTMITCDIGGLSVVPLEPPQSFPPLRTLDSRSCYGVNGFTTDSIEYKINRPQCLPPCSSSESHFQLLRVPFDGHAAPVELGVLPPLAAGQSERARCSNGARAYTTAEPELQSADGWNEYVGSGAKAGDLWVGNRRVSERAYFPAFSRDCRHLRWKERAERSDGLGELLSVTLPDGPRLRLGRNVGTYVELSDGRLLLHSNLIISGSENRLVLVDEDLQLGRWLLDHSGKFSAVRVPELSELLLELRSEERLVPDVIYRVPIDF